MSTHYRCDYCGEPIYDEGEILEITCQRSGYGLPSGDQAFHFHSDRQVDSDSCYSRATGMLDAMKLWAHEREGSGLVWSLVEQNADRDERYERRQRKGAGTPLESVGLLPALYFALSRADLATLEEVAECREEDVRAIRGVGPQAIATLRGLLRAEGLCFADVRMGAA